MISPSQNILIFHRHRLSTKDTTQIRHALKNNSIKSRQGLSNLLETICYEGDTEFFDCLMSLPDGLRPNLNESNNWPFKLAAASGCVPLLEKIYTHSLYRKETLTDRQVHQSLLFAASENHQETVRWLAKTFETCLSRTFLVSPKCSGKIWEDLSSNVIGYKDGIKTLFSWIEDKSVGLPSPDWEYLLYYALNNDARHQMPGSKLRAEDLFSVLVASSCPDDVVLAKAKRFEEIINNNVNDNAPKKLIMSILNEKRLRLAAGLLEPPARLKI